MRLLKWAESRCWLNSVIDPPERVTVVLMQQQPWADWLTMPELVSLTLELFVLASVMLTRLQEDQRLSNLSKGLPNLLLYDLWREGPDKLTQVLPSRARFHCRSRLPLLCQTPPHPSSSPQCRPSLLSATEGFGMAPTALRLELCLNPGYLHW